MTSEGGRTYAGDVTAREAWERLGQERDAALVDVRTRAEWSFVGIADMGSLGKEPVLLEWQSFPNMTVDSEFAARLTAELAARGLGAQAPLYFICRSGARSAAAAAVMTAASFAHCYNVAGGFEGRPDEHRHRGQIDGWKAEGLPWVQS